MLNFNPDPMNPELTRIIEQYLNNELSADDRAAFEGKLSENPALQTELELQKLVHEGAKRAAQRAIVRQTGKNYHLRKNLVSAAIAVVAAGAIALTAYLALRATTKESEALTEKAFGELVTQMDDKALLEHVPAQYFNLPAKDTVVFSENGVLLSVPEDAFLLNGQPYSGAKVVQWQEALDAATIVKGGLSTMSGDRLLETQGMFSVQAFTPDGKKLDVNPEVGVYVQVPVDELKPGMQLFEGKPGKDGVIDWQNPQPLEKLPVMADMSDLNFYPAGYEQELNSLKWNAKKAARDSLYLSFEDVAEQGKPRGAGKNADVFSAMQEPRIASPIQNRDDWRSKISWSVSIERTDDSHGVIVARATLAKGWRVFSVDHELVKSGFLGLPTTMQVKPSAQFRLNGTLKDGRQPQRITDDSGLSLYFEETAIFRQSFTALASDFSIPLELSFQVCNQDGCILPPAQSFSVRATGFKTAPVTEKKTVSQHISPAKVMAFWNPRFNKTILATRDFEKRMQAVHATCSEEILSKYTGNLNLPLYEIDEQVAAMGHPEFSAFAAERVGGVNLRDSHLENLNRFYETNITKLRDAVSRDKNFILKQELAWNRRMDHARVHEQERSINRQATNLSEEFNFNLRNVYRQLGTSVGFRIRRSAFAHNIDRYVNTIPRDVMNATVTRTTTVITSPRTGKTATITYNDFSVSVDKPGQYGKLFLYLFPHELNSFQRINPVKGLFDYRLNNDIEYDLAVVGMNDDSYYLYTTKGLNKGALGTVPMAKLREEEFNRAIEALNKDRISKPMKIVDELRWLSLEKQDYKVQRLRQEQAAFRRKIRAVIFPCEEDATDVELQEVQI